MILSERMYFVGAPKTATKTDPCKRQINESSTQLRSNSQKVARCDSPARDSTLVMHGMQLLEVTRLLNYIYKLLHQCYLFRIN
jgi:hypothetical protein